MGKLLMFLGFVWIGVCLAGGIMSGGVSMVTTRLTADIDDSAGTIPVSSTAGFPENGIIVIEKERIAYSSTSSDEFKGSFTRPLQRGASGTDAKAHDEGKHVSTVESSMLNSSLDYDIALISDASGLMAFVQVPLALFDMVKSFIFLPIGFLGTDLQILTYIWGVVVLGFIVVLFISLAGGRRV